MDVWEVFSRRTADDPLTHVGSIKAPDLDVALLLARETFFRHGEGVDCWVARRADLHRSFSPETLGGVTDKSYRRPDGYVGIGQKHKRMREQIAKLGIAIKGERPPSARKAASSSDE
jgi:ring-1,2-phenylacetyl-CoA epoxidase subunit PaaB